MVTGDGKAEKKVVETCLKQYFGEHEYACDDESDAAAVGLAFLMSNGLIKAAEPAKKAAPHEAGQKIEPAEEKEVRENA